VTRTSAPKEALKRSALKGVFWSALEGFFRFGFQFAITVALARLLTPAEFGIVAIVYVFTGVGSVLVEGGLSAVLVQRRDLDEEQISTIFHFQWVAALIFGLSLGLMSPWIAGFYGYSILEPIIWAMALNVFLGAFGWVQGGLLSRALNFRLPVVIGVVSTVVAGVVAVLLAFYGGGVWALALQSLVATLVSVSALWLCHPWRPRMVFRPALLKSSFEFGGFLLLSRLLELALGRLSGLFVGKMYGAADLGQFNRANGIQGMVSGMIIGLVQRLAFPIFSAIQDDKPRLRAALRKALVGMMAINIPAMLGLLAVAEPLVITLLGDAWRPSVPLLRILCLVGLVWPLHIINLHVLLALGHSRLFFHIEIAKKTFGTVAFLTAVPFGLEALAWSQVLYGAVCFAIHAHYTKRLLGYSGLAQVCDCLPWVVAGVLMACSVWALQLLLALPASSLLVAQVVLGATLYFGFWLVWDPSLFRDIALTLLSRREILKA
jgi:teichuronic acid exporter